MHSCLFKKNDFYIFSCIREIKKVKEIRKERKTSEL